jgi:hypothetical protein
MAAHLADLRGLRSAPAINADQRQALLAELKPLLAACEWFTIGIMAPSGITALRALRDCEQALGWQPLQADPASGLADDMPMGVFLKGNQGTGRYLLRPEQGLGEGLLISGHCASDPGAEDTWGPLPLDLFCP